MSNFLLFKGGEAEHQEASDQLFGEGAVLRLLQEAGRGANRELSLAKLISQILVATSSSAVRNAAALALADLGATGEIEALMRVVSRPELAKECGTPLYALEELGASIPFALLVDLIENGSFEARSEALHFIDAGRVTPLDDAGEETGIRRRLVALAETGTDEVSRAATLLLEILPGRGETIHG